MRISTPEQIEEVAWQGLLEPSRRRERFMVPPEPDPRMGVTLGKPAVWAPKDVLEHWSPPAGGSTYRLVRLACSFRSPISNASLTVYLHPKGGSENPIAHDMFPLEVSETQSGELAVGLGPALKFGSVGVELAKAEAVIHFKRLVPVILAYGVGESRPSWTFEHHSAHPLVGTRTVYVVVELPPAVDAARLSLELSAQMQRGWQARLFDVPEPARQHLSWVI